MKKRDMAINVSLILALIAFFLNLPEEGYLKFVDLRPIAETEIAKVLSGDTQDCLTSPSQTKPVSMEQALNLEGKTTRQVLNELGNSFCEGKKGTSSYLKYLTDTGKTLYIQLDKSLDEPIRYGFDIPEATSPAATTQTGRSATDRSVQLPRKPQGEGKALEKR